MKFPSLLFTLFLVPSLTAQTKPEAAPKSGEAPPAGATASTVRVVHPAAIVDPAGYIFPGRTEPYESARVFTRATGIVLERKVDIGDHVKAGDTLAVISVPDIDREVEAAKASVELAEVRAANSHTEAKRSKALLANNAISREESDQRESAAAAADAAVRVAKAELDRVLEQQRFATVISPFDATIAARNFDRGDRVRGDSSTAENWLFEVVHLSTLRFAVQIAPDLAMRLTPDSEATITFGELPGKTFTSKITRKSSVFDPATGTMRIELEIANPDFALPAGLTGIAMFQVPPSPGGFLVPSNTVLTREGKAFLALVDAGKVAFLPVTTGRNLGTNIEVLSGELRQESEVIINPNALLKAGDPVSVAVAQE